MQRYFAKDIIDNQVILYETDKHHIKNVMRMKENDKVEIVFNKKIYTCKLDNNLSCIILKENSEQNELNKSLIVAVGLVKEQKMDLILQKLTELGVNKIIPVNMDRSIVKIDSKKKEKKLERWNMICKEASEQSKRNSIPVVTNIFELKDLVKVSTDKKIVCVTDSENCKISSILEKKDYKSLLVVIGPEGGISKKEEEFLAENNFTKISFGNLIFRVETACIYIASIFNYVTNKN